GDSGNIIIGTNGNITGSNVLTFEMTGGVSDSRATDFTFSGLVHFNSWGNYTIPCLHFGNASVAIDMDFIGSRTWTFTAGTLYSNSFTVQNN
ncbi:hypothetical protein, partial [Klebsiella pneumoniae]|uniref:hypothetical protein n=1 Tax=Klebsiella pneumoniae TaxID=573 RepID=UPI0025A2E828